MASVLTDGFTLQLSDSTWLQGWRQRWETVNLIHYNKVSVSFCVRGWMLSVWSHRPMGNLVCFSSVRNVCYVEGVCSVRVSVWFSMSPCKCLRSGVITCFCMCNSTRGVTWVFTLHEGRVVSEWKSCSVPTTHREMNQRMKLRFSIDKIWGLIQLSPKVGILFLFLIVMNQRPIFKGNVIISDIFF